MRLRTGPAGKKKFNKKKLGRRIIRKKFCRFCADKVKDIDYKDTRRLESFITERGKILSSRISGNCARHQRRIAALIKKARFLSLVPYAR